MAETNISNSNTNAWSDGIVIDGMQLYTRINNNFEYAKRGRSKWTTIMKESREAFFAERKKMEKPYQKFSDMTVPVTTIACEGMKSHIMSVLLPENPTVAVKATKDQGIDIAEKATDLVWWQMLHRLGLRSIIYDIAHDVVVDGTKVIMVAWDRKHRRLYNPETGQLEDVFEEGPKLISPKIDDIFVPANTPCIAEAPFAIRRYYLTPNEIKIKASSGFYTSLPDRLEDFVVTHEDSESVKSDRKTTGQDSNLDKDDGVIEMREWFGWFDVNGDGIDEHCYALTIVGHNAIIRLKYLNEVSPTDNIPMQDFRLMRIPKCFYGISLPRFMKALQEQIDIIYNMRNTAGMLASSLFGTYRPAMGLPAEEIEIEPGILLPADDPRNDIYFPTIPFNPGPSMMEEQNVNQYIQRLTGIDDLSMGQQPSRVGATRTYGGLVTMLSRSAQRLLSGMYGLQDSFIGIFKLVYDFDAAFLPENYAYRVVGEGGEDVFREIKGVNEIRQTVDTGVFDFVITLDPEKADPNVQRELVQMMYQLLIQNPIIARNPKSMYRLTKNLIEKFGVISTNSILPRMPKELMREEIEPEDENLSFAQGIYISPLPDERHSYHLVIHEEGLEQFREFLAPEGVRLFERHIKEHMITASSLQQSRSGGNGVAIRGQSIGSTINSEGIPEQGADDILGNIEGSDLRDGIQQAMSSLGGAPTIEGG